LACERGDEYLAITVALARSDRYPHPEYEPEYVPDRSERHSQVCGVVGDERRALPGDLRTRDQHDEHATLVGRSRLASK
jgi:hypothetical protein